MGVGLSSAGHRAADQRDQLSSAVLQSAQSAHQEEGFVGVVGLVGARVCVRAPVSW